MDDAFGSFAMKSRAKENSNLLIIFNIRRWNRFEAVAKSIECGYNSCSGELPVIVREFDTITSDSDGLPLC